MGDLEPEHRLCSNWAEIADWINDIPTPRASVDDESGGFYKTEWVFRGLRNSIYDLQPAIEREVRDKSMEWSGLETLVSSEFKARARMHLAAALIPTDEITWLAQMQHYAVPTRLLDFTHSPFVALYFAIRNGSNDPRRECIRLWAVNASAVNKRFSRVAWEAKRKSTKETTLHTVGFTLADLQAHRDDVTIETHDLYVLITESLSATGEYRWRWLLNESGCVCAASPPSFNPRLVSQQGIFLLNCAEKLNFIESLGKMIGDNKLCWRKAIDIPVELIPEIESRLFQMNVHEQSLFPDVEGLAGFIRQKLRLHWK